MPRKHSKTGARSIARAEQIAKVLDLRRQRLSSRKIARLLGFSHQKVIRLANEGLDDIIREPAEGELRRQLDELDALQSKWFRLATGYNELKKDEKTGKVLKDEEGNPIVVTVLPDSTAFAAVMRILDRRARLRGIDAPVKQEHSGPDGGPIVVEGVTVDDLEAMQKRLGLIMNTEEPTEQHGSESADCGESAERSNIGTGGSSEAG